MFDSKSDVKRSDNVVTQALEQTDMCCETLLFCRRWDDVVGGFLQRPGALGGETMVANRE
jgi:hypothetical protein